MAKYIEIDNAVKTAIEICVKVKGQGITQFDAVKIADAMEGIPPADVVEVVRCGQCKDFEPHGNGKGGICRNRKCKGLRYATDFCSYGERKDA